MEIKKGIKKESDHGDIKRKVQTFGRFLSGMVMPNIGAFIAWGIITALFIPTGWFPNEEFASIVDPTLKFLLPILIGYTGGHALYGVRGGITGAVGTIGVIVGSDAPMFLGAMVMGPLGGFVIKKFDNAVEGKIKAGFEMLVNNFSSGIIGAILCIIAYVSVGPMVDALNTVLTTGVSIVVQYGLLPLVSIFVEPAKVLFLNNALNHGILGPIGIQEAAETGKSIFFLLESNPGPGLGILLAYFMFAKGTVKETAPGAMIIHFFGGIHEIYFPYILMNPLLILAVIAGSGAGILVFTILGAGLIATPSPGSIFALMAMAPKGGMIPILIGIGVSVVVSFMVASFFIKRKSKDGDMDIEEAENKMKDMKSESKKSLNTVNNSLSVKKIIVACDAGMGSSAMGATTLRNKLKKANINVEVMHCPVDDVPSDAEIVVTHRSLSERAKKRARNAVHISIDNFIKNKEYDELVEKLKNS